MDAQIPEIDDHCRIQIYVQSLGRKQPTIFNSVLERLHRICYVEVCESPRRIIRPCFITTINNDLQKFGELQAHRKVFGFLGIVCVPTKNGEADAMAALGASRASFDNSKEELNDTVLNSKCVTFGLPDLSSTFFNATDLVKFESVEESSEFEQQIREFLRSIYFILESRRLDTSFESLDQPVCPILIDEERYLIGVKGRQTKSYRKKCIGRLRKQLADYAMLSGQPTAALDLYNSAADQLKSSGDLLWLAAANEGWAIASIVVLQQKAAEDYKKIVVKLKSALENYERFSFAAFIEFECVLRVAEVFKRQRMYIETEAFLRDHVGKYLDDEFTLFNCYIKAQICMICSEIFKSIGFIRKYAFYARLAVLFRLHVNDNEQKTEADYRIVYPVLYATLPGYGIQGGGDSAHFTSSKGHVSVQVKTLHEVFMSAQRAGYIEAAIRHLCYILQAYFFHIDDANKIQLIDELKRLVKLRLKKSNRISLAQPLAIEQCSVILPPIQMTRFPLITNFRIQPLPPNLAPNILPSADQATADVFIYSPFQERDRVKKILWVVNTVCQVTVQVQNLLPTELIVHSLVLHTEGCDFEAVPIRLNLTASSQATSTSNPPPKKNINGNRDAENAAEENEEEKPTSSSTEISLLGIPRSPGLLTVTGYSCIVFDMENKCSLQHLQSSIHQKQELSVQVLPALPKLQLQTSLKRAPVVDDETGVGEATIFSGETAIHTITLQNTDKKTSIRWIQCRVVDQPTGFGGPLLVELIPEISEEELSENLETDKKDSKGLKIDSLKPSQKRQVRFKIFGIDPAATNSAQETQVLVRKHQRANTANIIMDDKISNKLEEDELDVDEEDRLLERKDSVVSAPSLGVHKLLSPNQRQSLTHDLIPYTGRLLTASIEFTYAADIETANGESYERSERLALAITIVPALTVIDWQVIAGDSATTRFVVVDVTNLCDSEAELAFGADQRLINVQPRELCRVPLLCPCSSEIHAADFQQAAQRASHMLQKQEMEQLRRRLEKHISTHLEIRWKIAALEIEGLVPVGPLLASVSFLKQLVVPSISVSVQINGKPYMGEGDVLVGIGEMQKMNVQMSCVASSSPASNFHNQREHSTVFFKGEFALKCFQDLQNGKPPVDRMENLVVCGVQKRPFNIKLDVNKPSNQKSQTKSSTFKTSYSFFFRTEGVYKLRPNVQAWRGNQSIQADELFVPNVSFNVVTKLGPSNNKN